MACVAEALVQALWVNAQVAFGVAEYVQWAPYGTPGWLNALYSRSE